MDHLIKVGILLKKLEIDGLKILFLKKNVGRTKCLNYGLKKNVKVNTLQFKILMIFQKKID